jgi:hypothetical protein
MPHYRVILHALNYLILELHEYFTVSYQVMKINYNLLNLLTIYNIYRSVKSIDLINLLTSQTCKYYIRLTAGRGVSRGQRNGSPRPLISVL